MLKKESTELTVEEHEFLRNEINNLKGFDTPQYSIKFNLALTMIDGKVYKLNISNHLCISNFLF